MLGTDVYKHDDGQIATTFCINWENILCYCTYLLRRNDATGFLPPFRYLNKGRFKAFEYREVPRLEICVGCCCCPGELRAIALAHDDIVEESRESGGELLPEGACHELHSTCNFITLSLQVSSEDEMASSVGALLVDESLQVIHSDTPIRHRLNRLASNDEVHRHDIKS